MGSPMSGPLRLQVEVEHWKRVTPVRITGYTYDVIDVVVIGLAKDGRVGRAEAGGVYYKNDKADGIAKQIEEMRSVVERGIDRDTLHTMLPPCGARNALDCALWDLEAKLTGRPAWQLAGLDKPRPLLTAFTCHADEPEKVVARAKGYSGAKAIKLKLLGDAADADRVTAVRESLPDVWLGVDANQGFTQQSLEKLMPVLIEARVALIEQPFPIGQEAWLDTLRLPIPVAADESVQALADIPALVGRFDVVNIKLDKCGGLTEALQMARFARRQGLEPMVGNMSGTSLAMAPAFLVGQMCSVVDLDGPAFLKSDRPAPVQYVDGLVTCPDSLWGYG